MTPGRNGHVDLRQLLQGGSAPRAGRSEDVPAHEAQMQGRSTQGVRIMNVKPGDEVAAVARIT